MNIAQAVVDPPSVRFILDSMKLGLISDVHGDWRALQRAQLLLYQQHQVDAIWCAGDLVGRGLQPNEVVWQIMENQIPAVMGNHDEMMISPWLGSSTLTLGDVLGVHPRTLAMLTALPRTYRARLDSRTVVMVHGSPRSNTESLSLHPHEQQRALSWLPKIGADILIAGHTHTPMKLQNQHGIVVNPGSLFDATNFERASSETYGVLDVALMEFSYYPLW